MKNSENVFSTLTIIICCGMLIYILHANNWTLPGGPVTIIVNRNVYIQSDVMQQPRSSFDRPRTNSLPSWFASSKERTRVYPYPLYEDKTTQCHLPVTGVKETMDPKDKGLTYGRVWPLVRCKGHTNASERLCKVLARQLHECDRQALLQIVDIFLQFANSKHWRYFMGNMMLLGSWRHHGLVPYERDLTVFVSESHATDVVTQFAGLNTHHMTRGKHSIRITPKSTLRDATYFDILFFHDNGTHVLHTSSESADYVIKKDLVFPTHFRAFGPFDFQAPNSSAVILRSLYGDADMCGRTGESIKIPCSALGDYEAFVYRRVTDYMGPIEERLVWGDITFAFEFPREAINSVSDNPFTLKSQGNPV